ncbi:MAG: hypothetical protein FJX75_24040 [Armatimonadetes bacterium]|nr:hypothetical protein [Armatimonadota bacterium]
MRRLLVLAALALIPPTSSPQADVVQFTDAFDTGLADRWTPLGGEWQVADGRVQGKGTGDMALRGRWWRDVTVEVSVAISEADGPPYWAGIRLRTDSKKSPGSGYLVYLRRSGDLEIWTAGQILAAHRTDLAERLARGESVRLGARVVGKRIEGLIDGKALVSAEADSVRWGEVALAVCGATGLFDDLTCEGTTAGGIIHGQVLNYADQLPVADTLVETYHSFDGYPSLALQSTRTDAEGRYLLEGLPPGEKAYWLRACREDCGGGTGWFVTVSQDRPTEYDLLLIDRPPAEVWIDSAALTLPSGWEEVPDPQCYGGSRAVIRTAEAPEPPELHCRLTIAQDGVYVLHIASGLYEKRHYWSPYSYSLDGGEWREAMSSLTFESPRYGDRATFVWAHPEPVRLSRGEHDLAFRVTERSPAGPWYGTFDALAVERLPEVGAKGRGAARGEEVVLQFSSEPDFSEGTLTVPRVRGGTWRVPGGLVDGTYWWRVKRQAPESSCFRGVFGSATQLTIATEAAAVQGITEHVSAPGSATISWKTDEACESWLEWDVRTFEPRFQTPVSRGRTHVARLSGLEPMTCHRYWIVVRGPWGERRTLRRQFLTPRRELSGRQSPFGVFGQTLTYSQEFAEAGVAWMSDYWDWAALEPKRGTFDWTQAEERIARAQKAGLNVTVTTWGTPAWIRPSVKSPPGWAYTYGPEDLSAAREFFRRLTAHCRGRADWFLPWIEPNVARDPVFGYPRGYWASRPHAQTYAAYERAAYKGAKRGNPDCRLVGMNTAGVDLAFIEKCYDEGAADAFDVMNVHYYAMTGDFEKQDPEGMFAGLQALMARYGDAEKPILCSEGGGTSSGLPGTNEAMQAPNLVRIYVISIANNIDKLCWTFSHDPNPYGSDVVSMVPWMGLFRFDPDPTHVMPDLHGEPKPSYFAMRNMTSLLAGSLYRRRVALGEGIRAYRFEKATPEGRQRVTVLWSEEGERTARLPLAGQLARAVGHLGEAASVEERRMEALLTLTPEPVFVVESLRGPGP